MALTITAANHYQLNTPPAQRLTVTSTTSTPNAVPNNTILGLTRIHPDGTEHQVLAEDVPRSSGGLWIGYDYHCPYNKLGVTYRVDTVAGATATATAPPLGCERTWLVHQSDVSRSVRIDNLVAVTDVSTSSNSGRYLSPGATTATFISEGARSGRRGSFTVRSFSVARDAELAALWADDQPMLANTPGKRWDIPWMWMMPLDIPRLNPGRGAGFPFRDFVISYEEAADPTSEVLPVWTDDEAFAYFTGLSITDTQLPTLYATDFDYQTNTRL